MTEDKLLDSEEKKAKAILNLSSLIETPGWKFLEQVWEQNIEVLRQQLEIGLGEGEQKTDIDRLRDKLSLLREVKNTPQTIIKKLQTVETEAIEDDPYESLPVEVDKIEKVS